MQIKFEFKTENLTLPINYNHIMHGVVINWLGNRNYQEFIHNSGYEYKNTIFKLYTFSELIGKYKILQDGRINFFDKVVFYVSSQDDKFLNYLIKNSVFSNEFRIIDQNIKINNIETYQIKPHKNEYYIKTLSPITVYSTFKINNSKKTYYYNPREKDFKTMIKNNLIKKYISYYKKEPENLNFEIKVIGKSKQVLKRYKGFLIKGWIGKYKITGSDELIEIAFNTGLGSKNSQGFGMIKEDIYARSNL
ncbi:CRISPR-associated endoribonuclease Cas6 [Oceanotoga sp. DSM 15011]|jgi:CRISPR-associated endoribonuclease Cas6|uniref:CRISPR-associated endoribonuclease Cas6 n=1 Tax=Oceanotoga sp. DSM 15011 TaxID=2984951 RepID=UPI0021F46170|nr:CRISPR-associated endoribonuclease Cas6 [Oceanotoga sp. DSM 15011]UYP01353.1 CRISPR-associated endoribonuclease Cas6 [Oceanotoga sp. DSM 15011]